MRGEDGQRVRIYDDREVGTEREPQCGGTGFVGT